MIPPTGDYLSFLMGAPNISDEELSKLSISVVETTNGGSRCLLIPQDCVQAYKELIQAELEPGYWNELVGRDAIVFLFKLVDGTLKEFTYSAATRVEIAHLCSELNDDPIKETSDIPGYLARNTFYRELMVAHYGVRDV